MKGKNEEIFKHKNIRLIKLYDSLIKNEEIDIKKYAADNEIDIRTAQRDIEAIKAYFTEFYNKNENGKKINIEYNRKTKKHKLVYIDNKTNLSKNEVLAVSKVLLASRAFLKSEISLIIDKIVKQCSLKEDIDDINKILNNEKSQYVELQHYIKNKSKKSIINNDDFWNYGQAIKNQRKMEISYKKTNGKKVKRIIHPVGLMFSEFYFYLLAHIENIDKKECFDNKDDTSPTIYRVDRIVSSKLLDENFILPARISERFKEGLFRQQVQFMTGGKLRGIKLKCMSESLEAILDRLPTAKIKGKEGNYCIITAQVFGNGIDRWILSQGDAIEVIEDN